MVTQDKLELLALAKFHLGYPTNAPDELVPTAYLDELLHHTFLYPYDINFHLTLEPETGFGRVTCLEQGCNNSIIPLDRRSSFPDGGLRDGLGSLSAYRDHIHATHAEYQYDKQPAVGILGSVIDHATSAYPPDVKMEQSYLPSVIDNTFGSPSDGHDAAQLSEIVNEYSHVGWDPVETKLPGCLSISTAFPQIHSHKESSLVRINAKPPVFSSDIATTPSMWNVSSLIPATETTEAQLPCKRLSDVNNATNQSAQVWQVTPDVKRRKLEEIPANFNIPNFPLVNQNDETIRTSISDIQDEIITDENVLNSPRCKKKPMKVEITHMENAPNLLTSLRRHEDNLNPSLASLPAVKEKFSRFQTSTQEDTVVAPPSQLPQYQAVLDQAPATLGSSLSQPLPVTYYDDEGDDHMVVNQYEYNDDLAFGVLQSINPGIPEIAPLQGYEYEIGDDYGRSFDTFAGPQAKADDIDKFLIEAGNAQQFDGNAKLEQALEKLGLQSQYDLLPGMEVPLMPHQTIGVAWMIEKEESRLRGGCLSDDMGLGKTVQMIATLVKNRSKNPMCKTNLIIAPTSLLDQWKLELELKANCNLQCLIYHGSTRPKRKQDLLRYDVILTTYSTMALEWPDHENEMKKQTRAKVKKRDDFIVNDSEDEVLRPKKKQEQGLLFQVEFFRIILDEAQSIRNRRTRTSRAVTDLQATYRWCLTGTPIVNSLVDAYGYLRFLKVRPWYDWEEFQRHIGSLEKRNPTLAVSRLQTIITTFLLRRMKDTTMDGKRLIELPERKVSLVKLQFSKEERDIYTMVEAGAQANFNRFLKAGTVLKNYTQVLVLLLRLRQVCSHPLLVQEDEAAFISDNPADDDESGKDEELSRASRLVSSEFVAIMKAKLKASAVQRMEAEKQSVDATAEDEECPICFDAFTDAVVTPCTHVFCRECIVDVLNTPPAVDPNEPNRYKVNERPCPTCRSAFCAEKLFSWRAFLPSDAELLSDVKAEDDDSISDRQGKGRGEARPERLGENASSKCYNGDDDEKDARWLLKKGFGHRNALVVLDSDDEETPEEKEVIFGMRFHRSAEAIKLIPKFLASTKMKYMMERLSKLFKEHPDEKTLVVSQWTACLSLVSDYLTENGVIHVKYQGDMNRAKREQAIRVFMSRDKARVMLMSLKCGGVGLNLTRANNVISLDLGWSQAIEAQSFDRVHRLGQTRPVDIQRLVISDTVEDRVLAMQERKQQLADGSLGEGSGRKIRRLTVKELANLFGLDHRGRLLRN